MKGSHVVALVVVGGGAFYLLSRYNVASAAPLSPGSGVDAFGNPVVGPYANGAPVYTGYPTGTNANMPARQAPPNNQPIAGAAVSVGGAALSAAAGIGSAAAIATAGIAAGVGLLAWGIMDKGWFRGGEEGITVNPNRDEFLSQFSNFDYYRDNANPPGFYGLNLILVTAFPDRQAALQSALSQAHTEATFQVAANNIAAAVKQITPDQWKAIQAGQNAYRSGAARVPGTTSYTGV